MEISRKALIGVGIGVGVIVLAIIGSLSSKHDSTMPANTTSVQTTTTQSAQPQKVEVVDSHTENQGALGWSIVGTARMNQDFNGYINFDLLDSNGTKVGTTTAPITAAKAGQVVQFKTLPVGNSQATKYSVSGISDLTL